MKRKTNITNILWPSLAIVYLLLLLTPFRYLIFLFNGYALYELLRGRVKKQKIWWVLATLYLLLLLIPILHVPLVIYASYQSLDWIEAAKQYLER